MVVHMTDARGSAHVFSHLTFVVGLVQGVDHGATHGAEVCNALVPT